MYRATTILFGRLNRNDNPPPAPVGAGRANWLAGGAKAAPASAEMG